MGSPWAAAEMASQMLTAHHLEKWPEGWGWLGLGCLLGYHFHHFAAFLFKTQWKALKSG